MVILISGKMRVGKNLIASILQEHLFPYFPILAFGDYPKLEYASLMGIRGNSTRTIIQQVDNLKNSDAQHRENIVTLAEERKLHDPLVWVKELKKDAEYYNNNVIIPDLRFKTELNSFLNDNEEKLFIRIEADREIRLKRGLVLQENHPSETDLDGYKNWDHIIMNNFDNKEDLEKHILETINII